MIWAALLIAGFSFYELYRADHGLKLAVALFRLSLSLAAVAAIRFPGSTLLYGAIFLVVVATIGSMAILRKEIQLRNDQR